MSFIVQNGEFYEVHEYEYDKDGRKWEKTIFSKLTELRAKELSEDFNKAAYLPKQMPCA